MDVEEKELQLFLEVDDMEMQDITVMMNTERQKLKEKKVVGRGHSSSGHKRDYDVYESSDAFNRVKFFVISE